MGGRAAAAALSLFVALGCDAHQPGPAEIWCDGFCLAANRCLHSATVAEECHGDCVRGRPGLEMLSATGASLMGACLAVVDCVVFLSDEAWDANVQTCWEQAERVSEPSQEVRDFCAGYSDAWFECGYWLPTGECEGRFALWADEVLEQLVNCMSRDTCDELDSCVAGVFGT